MAKPFSGNPCFSVCFCSKNRNVFRYFCLGFRFSSAPAPSTQSSSIAALTTRKINVDSDKKKKTTTPCVPGMYLWIVTVERFAEACVANTL